MTRFYTLAALGVFSAACGSSTAPDFGRVFDTDAAAADYAALDGAFESAAWGGFQALGERTPFSVSAMDAVASLEGATQGSGRRFAVGLAQRLTAAANAGTGPAAAPIISNTHRGATFVYDPDTDQYAVDPERDGAPSNGVRFIVYEVDAAGDPIVTEEIGHADLIDEGDGSAQDVALRLVVVSGTTTVLDYRTALEIGLGTAELTVDGHLQGDNGVRLDFAIGAAGEVQLGQSSLAVDFALDVDARDFHIVGSVDGVEAGGAGEGDIDLLVEHGPHSARLDVSGAEGEIDGSVYLNDELFATVTGNAQNPTILSADGDPLTTGEIIVLHHIVDVVEDIFDFLEDLVDPVDDIVFLGWIL